MGQCPFTCICVCKICFAFYFLEPAGQGWSLGQVVLQDWAEGASSSGSP